MAAKPRIYFQTKVLIPTVAVMALLQGILMAVVSRRFTRQFSNEAHQSLATAQTVFQHWEEIRTTNKRSQYRNLANESRVVAVCQTAAETPRAEVKLKTLENLLSDLLNSEQVDADLAMFTATDSTLLASASRASLKLSLPRSAIESLSRSVEEALEGNPNVDCARIGGRLFQIASIPVLLPVTGVPVGVLSFGNEMGDLMVKELKPLTHSEIVFISGAQVAASTLSHSELFPRFLEIYNNFSAPPGAAPSGSREVILRGEHYLGLAGPFRSLNSDPGQGYLLLTNYEARIHELGETQRMLLLAGALGILLGSVTVWLIVRKLTAPLRELRDGAEAVGKGDFTRQVAVSSRDECGELAQTFNRMTANLRTSHAELEKTVETLKSTQAQLVQREKLSAIGEFVAGVAHELNNPLTAVIGFAELIQQMDPDSRHRKHLDTIAGAARRCHKIIQSLLSFSRQRPVERKPVSVNERIEATLTFMQYELRTSNVEVERSLAENLPSVLADSHQIQQVFLNIVNNARQAMEATRGGRLRVVSRSVGRKIEVVWSDSGPGISPENLSKIFNPFFTTKEVGKGTGLGLSVSYGIIQEHGGSIHVESSLGKGTSFFIELPEAEGYRAEASAPTQRASSPFSSSQGLGKKVLAIDDEEAVLELIREALTPCGYAVDLAPDGETGLARLGQTQYDLTLCDLKMPGLNGQQVYESLLSSNRLAASKLIFMTGDVVNDQTERFLARHNVYCMAKPFSIEEFKEVVGKMVREQPAATLPPGAP